MGRKVGSLEGGLVSGKVGDGWVDRGMIGLVSR